MSKRWLSADGWRLRGEFTVRYPACCAAWIGFPALMECAGEDLIPSVPSEG